MVPWQALRDRWFTLILFILVAVTAPLRAEDAETAKNGQSKEAAKEESESKSEEKKVRLARIVLDGPLAEAPAGGGLLGEIGTDLRKIIERIETAADDDEIAGLVIELKDPLLGPGRIHELRGAIDRFQESGKKVHAYFESASTGEYQVACACDSIYVPESGDIAIPGIYAQMTFFKGLFDKLGLKADFMHVGEAKAASEPFTRKEMSEPVEENLGNLVDDLYNQLVEHIAVGRKLPAKKVKKLIDKGLFVAKDAEKEDLVDELLYADEMRKRLAEEYDADELVYVVNYGQKKVDTDFSGTMGFIKLLQAIMGTETPDAKSKAKKVAVVYAVGPIFSGESTADVFGGSVMGSDTIVKALREANENDDVVAIVLRIDSPGGSALASDVIWRATTTLDKPIVASMGDVAGSGGYYIAMGCDKIYAEPGTITGSIGVVGGKIAVKGLFDKLGITADAISRGANAGIYRSNDTWNESEREVVRDLMTDIYEQFTTKAAKGRHMPVERLRELAEGKVYTGRDAKQLGLVDDLGTLKDAVGGAKRLAGVGDDTEVELLILPEAPSFFESLFGDAAEEEKEVAAANFLASRAGQVSPAGFLRGLAASDAELVEPLQRANRLRMLFDRRGAALVMPYWLDIR